MEEEKRYNWCHTYNMKVILFRGSLPKMIDKPAHIPEVMDKAAYRLTISRIRHHVANLVVSAFTIMPCAALRRRCAAHRTCTSRFLSAHCSSRQTCRQRLLESRCKNGLRPASNNAVDGTRNWTVEAIKSRRTVRPSMQKACRCEQSSQLR